MTDQIRAFERGTALLDLGRPVEAEAHLRRALAESPDDPDVLTCLARALLAQERYADALVAARRALAVVPDHLGGLLTLSAAASGVRDFVTALEAAGRAQQLAPAAPGVHRRVGYVLLAQDQPAEALAAFHRARSLDPEDAHTMAAVAAALADLRQLDQAQRAVEHALRLDPDNIEAHRVRGLLELRRGGGRAAVDAHRTALRLDPTDASTREALAVAMKSRNPLYGLLLRLGHWIEGLSDGARWAVMLAPFLATRVLRPFADEAWGQVLLGLVFVLVLLTWALEPVMNTVLVCSSYGRNLISRTTRLATYAFLTYCASAVMSLAVGATVGSDRAFALALGLGLWALSAGQTHLVQHRRRKAAVRLQYAGAALALTAVATALLGLPVALALIIALLFSGAAMLWFTAFA